MKSILFLANLHAHKFGSFEEHALFLSREMVRRNYRFYLSFLSEPRADIRQKFEEAGARVVSVLSDYLGHLSTDSKVKRRCCSLYRFIKENRIDLVHVNFMGLTNPALFQAYTSGTKIVFTEHASGYRSEPLTLRRMTIRILHSCLGRRISRIVGVSRYVKERMDQNCLLPRGKALCIYNGVNCERFLDRDKYLARCKLGIPPESNVICSVAMLIWEKGIHVLLHAIALLVHDHGMGKVLLLLVGEGEYRNELEQVVRDLDISQHVLFLGKRDDVQDILAATDVLVAPSLWEEAFGLCIAESMAAARPVIASRVGGIPEVVEDGVTGILVNPGDPDELSKAVYALFNDAGLQKSMGEAGFKRTRDIFSLDRQVVQLADLYGEVLND